MIALERFRQIFTAGLGGEIPMVPTDFHELEKKALGKMSHEAGAYIAGGAGLGGTMDNNRTALSRHHLLPRVLHGVKSVDTQIKLFGDTLPFPILLAPIGVLEMVHEEADLAVARAARETHTPMVISNQASVQMESIFSDLGDTTAWFQLYWSKSDELTESFIQRAEQGGAKALVVTLDTTVLGWRPKDLNIANLPFLKGQGIAQYLSDPVFRKLVENPPEYVTMDTRRPRVNRKLLANMHRIFRKVPGGYWNHVRSQYALKAIKVFLNTFSRPGLEWEDLKWLRSKTSLPIVLKGILHPDDARRAFDLGMNGIVVSNHGGRQVDDSIGAADALQMIAPIVPDENVLLFDSGIRTGSDIFKALALGADAVLLGRPYVYGLAINGNAGVVDVLKNLRSEFEINMLLCGCGSVDDINENCISSV